MKRPGNFVDLVLLVAEPSGNGQQVVPLLGRVKIVATGQILRGADDTALPTQQVPGGASYTTVTVEVTPEESARIALAQQSGRIRAVLRNPNDDKEGDFGHVNTASLTRTGGPRGGADGSVEFIIGGKGGGAGAPVNINIPSLTIPGITPPGGVAIPPSAQTAPGQLFSGSPAAGMIPSVPSGAAVPGR
jgi:pilus assembly protein CpaB